MQCVRHIIMPKMPEYNVSVTSLSPECNVLATSLLPECNLLVTSLYPECDVLVTSLCPKCNALVTSLLLYIPSAYWLIRTSTTDVYVTIPPNFVQVRGYPYISVQNIKFVPIFLLLTSHFMFWIYQGLK